MDLFQAQLPPVGDSDVKFEMINQLEGQNGAVDGPLPAEPAPQQQQQQEAADQPPEGPKPRKHKWGPPAAGDWGQDDQQKKKKRRSRWETSTELIVPTAKAGAIIIPGQLPREVTICGGLKARKRTCSTNQSGIQS